MSDTAITWPGSSNTDVLNAEIKETAAAVVLPDEGKTLHAFGDKITVHLGSAQTGGRFTLFTDVTPPGGGPPPHYHNNEDEWFLPLEGQVEFFIEGSWQEVPMGTAIFVPRGMVHTFRNSGDSPLKMLTQTSPAGFEVFFECCAAEFAKDGSPDMGRIIAISAEHGIYFVTD